MERKVELSASIIYIIIDIIPEIRPKISILAKEFFEGELKKELVKLAVRSGIKIETVSGSHTLNQYGGAGCLLRYLWPAHYT